MGSAIFTSCLPVVTAWMLVWKERLRGAAHAEVFLCWRNVWVLLPRRSWSADRHGWQNTAPCSRGEGFVWGLPSQLLAGPGFAVPAGCSAERRSRYPGFTPGAGWAGLAGGGHVCILSPKERPLPQHRAVMNKSGDKALGRELDRAPALLW